MKHIPNRRTLNDDEQHALDAIVAEYEAARAAAAKKIREAHQAYQAEITRAINARDDALLAIVEGAEAGTRATQSRIVEYLGTTPSNLSIRLKKARTRRIDGNGATPGDLKSSG